MKTWLTGSGRSGLRRRALTRRSVISESLGKSMVLSVGRSDDCGELGSSFFIMESPESLKGSVNPMLLDGTWFSLYPD